MFSIYVIATVAMFFVYLFKGDTDTLIMLCTLMILVKLEVDNE